MATFTVNNNNDSGLGSLRQAIADANAAIGLDTIEFDNNLSEQQITLTSGELQVTDSLTINGLGADLLTVSGNNLDRVFLFDDEDRSNQIDVILGGLTITGGTNDDGAGIANAENLTLLDSNILDNAGVGVSSEFGNSTLINSDISDNTDDGITFVAGSLAVINSNISNNLGLGIVGYDGGWEITNSTISANGSGGISLSTTNLIISDSIISDNTGTGIRGDRVNFEIDNTIISGNTTTVDGGGISGGSSFFSGTITNSQIIDNIADSDGDGLGNGGGVNLYIGGVSIEFSNTIIAGNLDNSPAGSEQHPNLSGPGFSSGGSNFVADITGVRGFNPDISFNPFTEIGDLFGTSENPLELANFIGGSGLRVEAEDYVTYSDTTAGNTGGAYRSDDVDIEVTTDIGDGFNVGYINDGEWLTYDIDIPESGLYQVVARVASNTTDGRVHHLDISLDDQSAILDFEATGGWQSWTDVIGDNLNLSAGSQELRLDLGSSGFNINYVDLIPLDEIRVEAEDYVTYSDTTAGNTGGAYRSDDVDIEATTDIGGGFNVGYINDGEWLTYDIDIPESGLYQVVARVASNTTDGRVHNLDVSLDGQSTSLGFEATGGWQSWTDVIGDNLNLSAGSHELRLDLGSSGFNINYVDLIPVEI